MRILLENKFVKIDTNLPQDTRWLCIECGSSYEHNKIYKITFLLRDTGINNCTWLCEQHYKEFVIDIMDTLDIFGNND